MANDGGQVRVDMSHSGKRLLGAACGEEHPRQAIDMSEGGEGQMLTGQPVKFRDHTGVIESEPTTDNLVKVRFTDRNVVTWIDVDRLEPTGPPVHTPIAEAAL